MRIRKVEIHDVYDLKRWWWKANDGIRETTWPGVYNRSRLPGRNDYFQLPDWDCYSLSGTSVRFVLPDEPWNQVEVSGAAFGSFATDAPVFERPKGQERTFHRLARPARGRHARVHERRAGDADRRAWRVLRGAGTGARRHRPPDLSADGLGRA